MSDDNYKKNKKKFEEAAQRNEDLWFISMLMMDMAHSQLSAREKDHNQTQDEQKTPEYDFTLPEQVQSYRNDLNAGIASISDRLRGTPYEFGGKDCQGIDCSGFVAAAVGEAMSRAGVSLDFIKKLHNSSQGQLDVMKNLGVNIHRNADLSVESMRGKAPMFVAIDTGARGFDAGRADGIDHVVVIYEKTPGNFVVAQSNGSNGVNDDVPLQDWLDKHNAKGTKMFGVDLGEAAIAARQSELSQSPRSVFKTNFEQPSEEPSESGSHLTIGSDI